MKFTKKHLCNLPYCYAVGTVQVQGRTKYIFATDDTGPCYAIDAETEVRETIWDGPGGTMSIVPLPGIDGTFLASQNFLPGFSAAHAKIVKVSYHDGSWHVTPWLDLPYVHRFDILKRGDQYYFLGCILSSTKEEQADWDMPGHLVAAPLTDTFDPPVALEMIADGMSQNHGYFRVERDDYPEAYIACREGVFKVAPPSSPSESWSVAQLLSVPTSDIAIFDIDGDGVDELATIEPFHGESFVIYRKCDGVYQECYRYPKEAPFLHAIWGGKLCGESIFLVGCRGGDQEFFLARYKDGEIDIEIIESGFGPSNIAIRTIQGKETILIANREKHEAALFTVEET